MTPPTAAPDRKLSGLIAKLQQGDCVLVLGPRVAMPPELAPPATPIDDYFAGKLVEELGDAATEAPNLRRSIARYERERSASACRSLVQELASELDAHSTDLHRDLAALPFRLILSATPDRMLVNALAEQGKQPREAYYDYGRAVDIAMALPGAETPLVYSMFGRHDHPESMVLNDKNLLDYLVNITRESPSLPDVVRATLRAPATVFLFVGFGFANWWLRLLLKVLEVTGVENRGVSLALEDSSSFEAAGSADNKGFFEALGIFIQARDWNAWARELASSYRQTQLKQVQLAAQAQQAAAAQPDAPAAGASGGPLVFLSYAREDAEQVARLRASLLQRGCRVWQDLQNLYAGQHWEDQLMRVVKRVDYFVFVQTENMDQRDQRRQDGVYNRELRWALERMEDMPYGATFLMHVTLGNCRHRPEPQLAKLHRIAVDSEAGAAQLVTAVLRSFQTVAVST